MTVKEKIKALFAEIAQEEKTTLAQPAQTLRFAADRPQTSHPVTDPQEDVASAGGHGATGTAAEAAPPAESAAGNEAQPATEATPAEEAATPVAEAAPEAPTEPATEEPIAALRESLALLHDSLRQQEARQEEQWKMIEAETARHGGHLKILADLVSDMSREGADLPLADKHEALTNNDHRTTTATRRAALRTRMSGW